MPEGDGVTFCRDANLAFYFNPGIYIPRHVCHNSLNDISIVVETSACSPVIIHFAANSVKHFKVLCLQNDSPHLCIPSGQTR